MSGTKTKTRPEAKKPAKKKAPPKKVAPVADNRVPALKVNAGTLRHALADVLDAVGKRAEIPILGHVRLDCANGVLTLTGTDLDRWVERSLPVEQEKDWKGFAIALPAHALADVLKGLPASSELSLTAPHEDSRAVLRCERARVKLVVLPVDDFPMPAPFNPAHGFDIAASELADIIAGVSHAISTEETRYYLNGIYMHAIEEPPQLRFTATDGHRLARVAVTPPEGASQWPAMIVPRSLVAHLAKLLDRAVKDAKARAGENAPADAPMAFIQTCDRSVPWLRIALPGEDGGEIEITAKTIDGTYPDYSRVIPVAPANRMTVAKPAMQRGVQFVSAIASDKTRAVRMQIEASKVTLTVLTPELGEASEEVPAALEGDSETIGFDAKLFLQALAVLPSDEVHLGYTDAGGPVLVTAQRPDIDNDRLVQVVMPVRV